MLRLLALIHNVFGGQPMDLTPKVASTRLLSVKIMRVLGINKVAASIYYDHIHGFDTASKFLVPALERCFQKLAEAEPPVSGDYMEFGLFKSYSFWYAQQVAQAGIGLHALLRLRFFRGTA